MDFRLTPEEQVLQREACEWLSAELGTTHESPPRAMAPAYMPAREFELKVGAKGWLALSWPEEYGGGGRPLGEQFLVEKEIALHGGPATEVFTRLIIPTLIMHAGTEEQKRRYLPPMARGETTFCLGYSEPESGSDLASLDTLAVREGDDYVINGRKIWTSGAESSDYCWLAVRTQADVAKQAGVSIMIVPMDSPGVEVRPIVNLLDRHWFNETRFEDVHVPITERVGGEGEGWRLLGAALGVERITIYRAYVHWRTLLGMVRWAQERGGANGASMRSALAEMRTEYEIAELLLQRAIWMHETGQEYGAQAAMVKLFNTEWAQRLYETGVNLMGLYGPLAEGSPFAPEGGAMSHNFLSAVQDTIGAGTSEVQRNIVAIRGLGLPRG